MTALLRFSPLDAFVCTGAQCPDTCCKGWGMQMDSLTYAKYQQCAPELVDAVVSGEQSHDAAEYVMRRDPATDYCVKFEDGLCGVQKRYTDAMLGDACYFYPRVTRALGTQTLMTATLSCPEIARASLFGAKLEYHHAVADRLPATLKDYLPQGLGSEQALLVHGAFMDALEDADVSAERVVARIHSVAHSLRYLPQDKWAQAVPAYLGMVEGRLPAPERVAADPFNALHALIGIIAATHKTPSARLLETVNAMSQALGVTIDWERVEISLSDTSGGLFQALEARWRAEWERDFAPLLMRWVQMQLALALFPFAGLGETPAERTCYIGVRLAIVKLALMSACGIEGGIAPQDVVVRIVQSLARVLDHLADAALMRSICQETGWARECRLRGLLGDS